MQRQWIELDGLVNLRDVGGTPTTDGGEIATGRLLRSDNLQSLTEADIDRLLELGLTDVIDLRSAHEVRSEGPGPMTREPRVTIHHHSLFREQQQAIDEAPANTETLTTEETRTTEEIQSEGAVTEQDFTEKALPWVGRKPSVQVDDRYASTYLSYLVDRPDSVLAALRAIAYAEGASLVHCAAGKDRTGTIVALSMLSAGAEPDAVVADYAASSERIERIVARLLDSRTYADNLRGRPMSSHLTNPETMQIFVDQVEATYGGVDPLLRQLGWTEDDARAMYAKLRD